MTPDDLCKSGKEHGEQTALFAWAAVAALYGFEYARHDEAYDHRTRNVLAASCGRPYVIPVLSRLHAIHNQGHGDAIRGARARAEGVRAGVPDTFLPMPKFENGGAWVAGLYIELKQRAHKDKKGGGVTEKQNDWITYLRDAGYIVDVAYGWREAADIIERYVRA